MSLDTGAAVNTFPLNFRPNVAGDGRFYLTASGENIPDGGPWLFPGYDENVLLGSLYATLVGAHMCRAVLQRLRAKDDKISTWDTTVFHDSGAGNHNAFLEFGELVWKTRAYSCMSRKQHFQFLP